MNIGRRFELLMAMASRNIPPARRAELLERGMRWRESQDCAARSNEELFYLWGAMAGMQMQSYCEDLQTRWGGEILKEALKEAPKK